MSRMDSVAGRACPNLICAAPPRPHMQPGPQYQESCGRDARVLHEAAPVEERARLIVVEQSRDGERRDVDGGEVARREVEAPPVRTVVGMLQPSAIERQCPTQHRRCDVSSGRCARIRSQSAPALFSSCPMRPDVPLAKSSANWYAKAPPMYGTSSNHRPMAAVGTMQAEMGRVLSRSHPLDGAEIRHAERADFPAGPGLLRQPLDGVVAVRSVSGEKCELAVRVAASSEAPPARRTRSLWRRSTPPTLRARVASSCTACGRGGPGSGQAPAAATCPPPASRHRDMGIRTPNCG